jgi:hypothetical protein
MFNIGMPDILGLVIDHVSKQGINMVTVLTTEPIKGYLIRSLTPDQLEWLSHDVQTHKDGLLAFMATNSGHDCITHLFTEYQRSKEPVVLAAAPQQAPALVSAPIIETSVLEAPAIITPELMHV